MTADMLTAFEEWAEPLLARLSPGERRQFAVRIAQELRRRQRARILAQQNPDGSAYVPRSKPKRLRTKSGRIKRVAMFAKLSTAKHFKVKADENGATIGFFGRVASIARVHQFGTSDRVSPNGPTHHYARRELLGLSTDDRNWIRDNLLQQLSP